MRTCSFGVVCSCLAFGPLSLSAAPQQNLPIPPLAVREGQSPMYKVTWVVHAYANWAPDGRTLVFQSNANGNWDLYTIAPDGNELRLIVSDPAADITPVFSPDGRQIAFVSERDGNREVYVCQADGSGQRRLTDDPGHDIHPSWSPDGSHLLFSSNRGRPNSDDYDIYTMSKDGCELRQITSGPEVDTYASWSPDGREIVTRRVIDSDNNEVFRLDAEGRTIANLTHDPAAYDGWPVWSPDGKRIAFSSGPPGASPHRICCMNADGTDRRFLTEAPPGADFVYDTQPAFSRDGRWLAFTRYRAGPRESSEICILRLPSS